MNWAFTSIAPSGRASDVGRPYRPTRSAASRSEWSLAEDADALENEPGSGGVGSGGGSGSGPGIGGVG